MPDPRLRTNEVPFANIVLPSFLKTYQGLKLAHLQNLIGPTNLPNMLVFPHTYWTDQKLISFDLKRNKNSPSIAQISGCYESSPKSPPPYSSLQMDVNIPNEDGKSMRGLRLDWHNHRYYPLPEEALDDLFIHSFQALPLPGEHYESFGAIRIMDGEEQLDPKKWDGEYKMHSIHIRTHETRDGGRIHHAETATRNMYEMIEVVLVDGSQYEIRVSADGQTFKKPFSIVIPSHIKVDSEHFNQTLNLLQ